MLAVEIYLREGKAEELRGVPVALYCIRRRACASTTGDVGPGDEDTTNGAKGDDRSGRDPYEE